jgi:hypothetical protein
LVAIKLDAVLGDLKVVLDLGEEEDTGKVERKVYVEVNPEQRIILAGIKVMVKGDVVLLLQVNRLLHPKRFGRIDDLIFVGVNHLAVFPFLLLA